MKSLFSFLSLLFILLFPGISRGMVIDHDTIWQGRLEIKEDVNIVPGVVLTVKPGTVITVFPSETTSIDPEYLSPMNEIMVRGNLLSLGTESAPIVFESGSGREWDGIIFASGSRGTLRYTTVRGARTALMSINSDVVADDVIFTASRYGVVAFGPSAHIRLSRCLVIDNDYGLIRFSGAAIDLGSSQVRGNRRANEFSNNTSAVVIDSDDNKAASPSGQQWSYRNEVLSGDTVWQGRVRVDGLLRVPDDGRLIIAPGTVVEFVRVDSNNDGIGESGLRIQGEIIAKGTPDRPIIFRSAESDKKAGDWDAINIFGSDRARNLLEYCRIENAYRGIHLHFANVGISHTVFRDNMRGAQFQESLVSFSHVDFYNNFSAIQARDSKVDFIDNRLFANINGANFFRLNLNAHGNTFANNLMNGLRIREGVSVVSNNRISANRFGLSLSDVYTGAFDSNVISGNLEAGILCRGTDNVEIGRNIVSANGMDGMRMINSRARIIANLINLNGERGLRLDHFSGVVTANNIVLNHKYQIGVDGPLAVDARDNWWGEGDLDREIYDGHDKAGVGIVDVSPPRTSPTALPWPLKDIRGDVSWSGRVDIAADPVLTVVKGARLNITPGTFVAFAGGAGMRVYGDIVAGGLPDHRIVFTGSGEKKPMSWGEISIEKSSGSRLANCDFKYATWGLHCHFVPISITGCRFIANDGGIRFRSGPMDISANLFRNNRIGIRGFHPAAEIIGNEFDHNEMAIFVREGGHGMAIHGNNFRDSGRYDIRLGDFNTEDVAAEKNWWSGAPKLFDAGREPGIGRVILDPMLGKPVKGGDWQ